MKKPKKAKPAGVLSVENNDESPATDYVLDPKANSCWITVDVFSIYIHRTDEGVVVDIFARRNEMDEPMASTYAFTNEALPSCKECFEQVKDFDKDWDGLCDTCRKDKKR